MKLFYPVKENDEYFEEIYPNIWLMDDHKWAFFIWEYYKYNNLDLPSTLVHLDYHWDAVNDFVCDRFIKLLEGCKPEELKEIIREDRLIRKDSYIAPAIIKKLVKHIYFYCIQKETQQGFYKPFLSEYNVYEFIFEDIGRLCNKLKGKKVILDLDLDLFNKSGMWAEGDLWKENEIINFIEECANLINNAKIITIAMSFNYSGNYKDTKYLTDLVVPKIINQFTK